MCKVQMLRALVEQRLTVAAEEIFGLFERTIAENEEELCRSKEENERQRELLDAVFTPQFRLHRADLTTDESAAPQSPPNCTPPCPSEEGDIHPSIHLRPLIRGRVTGVAAPAGDPKLPFPGPH
ncbi:uncharacterized protein LOC144521395 isoform X2 [Sander vitreus]